jgi:pimeloyl-ACP methyl ester carboxylesterase
VYDRTNNIASSLTNHWMIDGGQPLRPRLGEITAPTLVLHGTEDPLFPYGHAQALADEIPGARPDWFGWTRSVTRCRRGRCGTSRSLPSWSTRHPCHGDQLRFVVAFRQEIAAVSPS